MSNKFNFKADNSSKTLFIAVRGSFTEEDGKAYIAEYLKQVKAIDVKSYKLFLDCTELNVTSQDLSTMLQGCFEMYKNDGFGSVQAKIINNAVLKMQLSRLAKNVGLGNFEVIS